MNRSQFIRSRFKEGGVMAQAVGIWRTALFGRAARALNHMEPENAERPMW